MSDVQALIAGVEKFTADLVAAGPEACRRYLIDIGIYNEDGTLAEGFGGVVPIEEGDKQ